MNNNENEQNKSFRVNDRRRFDDAGNEKSQQSEVKHVPESSPLEIEEEVGFTHEEIHTEHEINFPSFIASLATQALILMGELPAPEGMSSQQDPEAARQTIDIIAMLREKTLGNLEPEEKLFLEEMLHNLRLSYLKYK